MDSQLTAGDPAASAAGDDQICRTSVGDLVKQINDAPAQLADGRDKRGRSESGDALPPSREAYTVAVSWAGARDSAPSQ